MRRAGGPGGWGRSGTNTILMYEILFKNVEYPGHKIA